jgi:hypothetical protein
MSLLQASYLYTCCLLWGSHLRSAPLEFLCTWHNDAVTFGNISGTPVEVYPSVPSSHFIRSLHYPDLRIFKAGEQGECSISVMDFWVRNCLTAPCELEHCHGGESNRWAKVQVLF